MFEKHNPSLKVPNDLIKWCIRLEFNKEILIEKNMKFESICFKLHELYPHLFIVHTAENSDNILIRIYIRAQHFKKNSTINLNLIDSFINDSLLNSIIRGVDNVFSTNCSEKIAKTVINDDGSIDKENETIIRTTGTNLKEIFNNEFIDPYLSQSDSIIEIYELLGIEAARNKIIIELMNMMPAADNKHYMTYADTMTVTGSVSSIDKSGIEHREKKNVLLNLANSHPLQNLESSAINTVEASCNTSLSPSLMVGQMPKVCSNYNKIIINESFIQQNLNNIDVQLDNL